MFKIYADDTLIYDSTIEDYIITSGQITKEVNKSGSFKFSMYPDNPYYDRIQKLKTIITVYKYDNINTISLFRPKQKSKEKKYYIKEG